MIRVKSVKLTCMACPSQWEGETDAGQFVYARYRHGTLRVDIAPSERAWQDQGALTYRVYQKTFGDDLDGILEYIDLKKRTSHLIEWPESDGDDGQQLAEQAKYWDEWVQEDR